VGDEVKVGLKSSFIKTFLLFIVLIGIIDYSKIVLSLSDGTYTKEFIAVSPLCDFLVINPRPQFFKRGPIQLPLHNILHSRLEIFLN